MATKPLEARLLAGSLNLLPPGDLIPPEDAKQLTNWRVDGAGNLRSRKGSARLTSSGLGAGIHTLGPRAGPALYAAAAASGSGSILYRETTTKAPALPARSRSRQFAQPSGNLGFEQIADGFDSNVLGIASHSRYAWFMNQSRRGKDDGKTFKEWIALAPSTPITAEVVAQEKQTIAKFEGEDWTTFGCVAGVDADGNAVDGSPVFDEEIKNEGSASLKLEVTDAPVAYATLPISGMDLGIGGTQNDEDKFNIWIYLSDPKQIENVHFFVDVNDGTFEKDYYLCTLPREFFTSYNPAGEVWTQIEMLRRLPVGDVTTRAGFERTGNTDGKDWSTVRAVRVQIDVRGPIVAHFDQWFIYGPATGRPINGDDLNWYVTFDTADGHETNPSPISIGDHVFDNQAALLKNIPISGDPQVTKRHIYREGGGLADALRAFTINDNATTEALDQYSNDDLTDLNIALEFDHDYPPSAAGLAGPFFGRLLAFSTATDPAKLFWTPANRPWYFPKTNSLTVGDGGETLIACSLHKRIAILYKESSIWRLIGDPDSGTLEQTNANVGIVGPHAWANAGAIDYFAGDDGIYSFNGDTEDLISERIAPIFRGEWTTVADGVPIPPCSQGNRANITMAFSHGRLWVSYPESDSIYPTITLIYDPKTGRWAHHKLNGAGGVTAFRVLYYSPRHLAMLGATTAGLVYNCENGNTDAGEPIALAYHSRYQDVGLPDHEKVFHDLVIEHSTGDLQNVLTIKIFFNNGDDPLVPEEALGSIVSARRERSVFRINDGIGTRALNAAVRIEAGNDNRFDAEVVIYAIYLRWYPLPRPSKTFDSGEIALGDGRMCEAVEVELDIEARADLALTVRSDFPGNALAVRSTKTVEVSDGRRNVQVPIARTLGRIWRLLLSADATVHGPSGSPGLFFLYTARLRARVIGVFVEAYEGAAGYVWDSTEVDLGTHLIKGAKSLMLEIDTEGSVSVNLHSDLAGNTIVLRRASPVSTEVTTTGRRIFKVPFPNAGIEGRLYRLTISGSQQYALYRAALEVRPIGVYVEQYEAVAGANWDSTELDLGIREVKECRQIEFDCDSDGEITCYLYSDLPGQDIAVRSTKSVNTEPTTTGRRKVELPVGSVLGRLYRVVLVGLNAWRLYGARLWIRPYGWYIEASESGGGAIYDSSEISLGLQKVKSFRELHFNYASDGPLSLTFSTDLPGNVMVGRFTYTLPAGTRRTIQIALPQNTEGRLMRATLAASAAYQLFEAKVQVRVIGTYVEVYEGTDGLIWDSTELDLGTPGAKLLEELRFDFDTDAWLIVRVYTDLPGDTMLTERWVQHVSSEPTTSGRRTVYVPLPQFLEGHLVRVTLEGWTAYRLYEAAIAFRPIGLYLNGGSDVSTGRLPASTEIFRTLDLDLGTERVKQFQELEVEARTDGPVTITIYTDLPGETMTARWHGTMDSAGSLERSRSFKFRLPGNLKGRLVAIEIPAKYTARIYQARLRVKTVGEVGNSAWAWADLPIPPTPENPAWAALPVEGTPPEWKWADLPLPATPDLPSWVDLPVYPTPAGWEFRDFPVDQTPDKYTVIDIPVDPVA